MRELIIPADDYSKFRFYLGLAKEVKLQILAALNNAPIGLQPKSLINFISSAVAGITKEEASSVCKIYFNLLRAKDLLGGYSNDFLGLLSSALVQTGDKDLEPTQDTLNEFSQLLLAGGNTEITHKIIDSMTENGKIFGDAKIYQDIRPFFENDNLIGSSIIHKMKVVFQENREIKEIYITLDDNDLDTLIETAKSAQNKSKVIKAHFNNANIIELK